MTAKRKEKQNYKEYDYNIDKILYFILGFLTLGSVMSYYEFLLYHKILDLLSGAIFTGVVIYIFKRL